MRLDTGRDREADPLGSGRNRPGWDENENGIPDECEEENRLGGEFGPPFENSEAYWAAVAEYREWAMQQGWGSNSELSGAEQFQRMVAKLQELGLPLRDPWHR